MKSMASLRRIAPSRSGVVGLRQKFLRGSSRGITTQELDRTKGDRERVVILGSGWAGFNLSRNLDTKKFQPVVVSPRSYFVFTPLLASTAVGTLEFRTTLESVRARSSPGVEFFQGWADDVDFAGQKIAVEEAAIQKGESLALTGGVKTREKGRMFDLDYDRLVVAVGCYSQTFGTPGVRDNALFLKDVGDARKIRKRILDCFETAALPSTSDALKKQLLNFAIVGGGPTGVEFAAELFDLCHEDMKRLYPALVPSVRITIYDVAPTILSMFDRSLATYALDTFRRDGIVVKTEHHIEELSRGAEGTEEGGSGCLKLRTREDGVVGVGMCVWSTGLMMNPFIQKALDDVHTYPTSSAFPSSSNSASITLTSPKPSSRSSSVSSSSSPFSTSSQQDPATLKWRLKRHPKTGGLIVDDWFRVKIVSSPLSSSSSTVESSPYTDKARTGLDAEEIVKANEATLHNVHAIGDVAVMEKAVLPATAQVANQESKWLAKRLNHGDFELGRAISNVEAGKEGTLGKVGGEGFSFRNLGVMTYIGNMRAIMQTGGQGGIKGRTAWLIWRGAYLTQTISWRNKLLVLIYWSINWLFGRDISRF